jgi:hypothetical protein
VLVAGLRDYNLKAGALYCAQAIRARRRAEARFLAKKSGAAARCLAEKSGHPRSTTTANTTLAHRAWRRNAERMARHCAVSLSRPQGAYFSLNLDKPAAARSGVNSVCARSFDVLVRSPAARTHSARLRKVNIWAYPYPGLKA